MNGKKAKALRKMAGFDPNAPKKLVARQNNPKTKFWEPHSDRQYYQELKQQYKNGELHV